MGHSCKICGQTKPNEQFSGKGHRAHICKSCKSIPKKERGLIVQSDEIFNFLKQSHISTKNINRLKELTHSEDAEISNLANIVLEVGRIRPYKKRRLQILAKERRGLMEKLEATGLILAHHF
ncbi:hypothetical protein HOF92_13470 [bacterium]|jgi:hypothetical protein|nr:hypothetical protein [bacterium]